MFARKNTKTERGGVSRLRPFGLRAEGFGPGLWRALTDSIAMSSPRPFPAITNTFLSVFHSRWGVSFSLCQGHGRVSILQASAFSNDVGRESSISSHGRSWFQLKIGWDAKIPSDRAWNRQSLEAGPVPDQALIDSSSERKEGRYQTR